MTVVIRESTLLDAEAIDRAEGEIFGTDAWSPDTVRAELSNPLSWYILAEEDGVLAGYGGLRSAPPGGQGDIQTLAVTEKHRRKGLGGRLLDALLDRAKEDRLEEVFLEVRADNHPAQTLYLSRGFREIARRPGYYQPDGVDALVMALNVASVAEGDTR
jgi:ribosomal-protein-alanine N-acetyltransferase